MEEVGGSIPPISTLRSRETSPTPRTRLGSGCSWFGVEAVAAEAGATRAQIALAWLLVQGDDIAPNPDWRRVARVEENTAADGIELNPAQIDRLDHLTPAAGERHNDAQTAVIDR
jgi:aryl-alcohol dehydrogenase-like predicted oxidoreductase